MAKNRVPRGVLFWKLWALWAVLLLTVFAAWHKLGSCFPELYAQVERLRAADRSPILGTLGPDEMLMDDVPVMDVSNGSFPAAQDLGTRAHVEPTPLSTERYLEWKGNPSRFAFAFKAARMGWHQIDVLSGSERPDFMVMDPGGKRVGGREGRNARRNGRGFLMAERVKLEAGGIYRVRILGHESSSLVGSAPIDSNYILMLDAEDRSISPWAFFALLLLLPPAAYVTVAVLAHRKRRRERAGLPT